MGCLVAVALMYAPLGGASWALYSAACCTFGRQCPIHGHHHSQTPSLPEHAMDCGHDMGARTPCSMSCCHHPERPAVASAVFLLPAPLTVTATMDFEELGVILGHEIPALRLNLSLLLPESSPSRLTCGPCFHFVDSPARRALRPRTSSFGGEKMRRIGVLAVFLLAAAGSRPRFLATSAALCTTGSTAPFRTSP